MAAASGRWGLFEDRELQGIDLPRLLLLQWASISYRGIMKQVGRFLVGLSHVYSKQPNVHSQLVRTDYSSAFDQTPQLLEVVATAG